jgi:CubicO group peptidase (beta-lactamase class C family)
VTAVTHSPKYFAFAAAALLGTLAFASPGAAQHRAAHVGWPEFVKAFDAFAAGDDIVGGGAVLVRDGRVVARHDYGWADRAAKQRADSGTIYHWASITKTLTAIAIFQLRDRGRLSLDDRVADYIPELRQVHDSFGPIRDVTIRMLLSHSAGFQNPTWPYTDGKPWQPFEPTRWEQLVAMMPYQEILFRPGSRYSYSNPAYVYLGRIIEQLSGDPWENYVQKNILTPLGLTRSYFGATPYHLAARRSNNYTVHGDSAGDVSVTANGRDFDPGITISNSGWNAPLGDMVTYAGFLTGATHGDAARAERYATVLSRKTLAEMWRPVVPTVPACATCQQMGLGFFVVPDSEHAGAAAAQTLVGHTGDQAGFRSALFLNPASGTAVIYVYNTANDARPDASGAGWLRLLGTAFDLLR